MIDDIRILFEDEEILVIEKPTDIIVDRASTIKESKTVQDWIESKITNQKSQIKIKEDNDFINRAGIVHRLDKETSGLLLIAKTPESFRNLQSQFKEGKVEKTYIALVHGKVIQENGEINAPIGRLPWNRTHFGILPKGRESKTFYKVLKYYVLSSGKNKEILTLLEVHPKTGRTHQIRVHFRYLNHPLFSDDLYAGRKNSKSDRKLLKRHFLHATNISFYHPKTNDKISFSSPFPSDLVDFLSLLTYTE